MKEAVKDNLFEGLKLGMSPKFTRVLCTYSFLELNGGTDIESTLVGGIRKVSFNLCMKCMKCQTSKLSLERLSVTVTVYLALKSHTFARLELKGEKMELSQSWNWWVASDKSLSYAGNA